MKKVYFFKIALCFCITLTMMGSAIAQTITATPGACSGTTNAYSITGSVNGGAGAPTTGNLYVSVPGEGTVVFKAPFTYPLAYTISNLLSDGASKTVTVTYSASSLTFSTSYIAPASCISFTCALGNPYSITYIDSVNFQTTDFTNIAVNLPKFNYPAATLMGALVTIKSKYATDALLENNALTASAVSLKCNVDGLVNFSGTNLIDAYQVSNYPNVSLSAGVTVPAGGTYNGDLNGSTLLGMLAYSPNILDALGDFQYPETAAYNWISYLTSYPNSSTDIAYFPPNFQFNSASIFTTAGSVAPPVPLPSYVGTGTLPITVSTLAGYNAGGGGGNLFTLVRTKYGAQVSVTYFYCANSVLGLNLLSFTGNSITNCNQLNWSTSDEKNVNKFLMERSTDNINFSGIGEEGATNSGITKQYTFNDCGANLSINNYYRLKMIDKDGTSKYSSIVLIKGKNDGATINVYPNPAIDNIYINATGNINTLEIVNAQGATIIAKSNIISGQPISVANLPSGMYLLKTSMNSGTTCTKFLKK